MAVSRVVIAVALLAMLACAAAAEANWRAEPELAELASGRALLGDRDKDYYKHDYKEKKHHKRCYYKCYKKKCENKRWGYNKCYDEEVDCKYHYDHRKQYCY